MAQPSGEDRRPAFQRSRNPRLPTSEMRLQGVEKVLIDYADARSLGLGISRTEFVVRLLRRDARTWAHQQMVAQRILGGNSAVQELADMTDPQDEEG